MTTPDTSQYQPGKTTLVFLSRPKQMLIGNEWVNAHSGKTLPAINPANGETLTTIPAGDRTDIDRAVNIARQTFETGKWAIMRPVERERLMLKLADLIEKNTQELAEIEALDNGKPVTMAQRVDIASAVDFLRYMAGWATKIEGSTANLSTAALRHNEVFGYTRREPVGVVGAIIPWNFPFLMAIWKIGPALTTGCTMVLKPAEETSLSALRLGELVLEAGYPPGVLNIVTGEGSSAGSALAHHPGINKLAFTGSTEIGKLVGKAAIENMTRLSLELGGKSPVIMLEDVDTEQAAMGAAQAIFFNSGQVCTAGSRLFIQKKRFDTIIADLAGIASSMKTGPGIDPNTQLGPLVSAKQQQRVLNYIESGLAEGAHAATGGSTCGHAGYFVQPTVLVNTRDDMKVVREEIFGPVVVAMPFDDIDDIVRRANDTPYGLAASIWSNNLSQVNRLIPRIKAGTVWVNCHNILDNAMPFGGYKQSGIGREMGQAVLDMYTETKSVIMAF